MVDKKGNSQSNFFSANGRAEGEGEKTVRGAELRGSQASGSHRFYRNVLYSAIL